jgi:hypothetical protein
VDLGAGLESEGRGVQTALKGARPAHAGSHSGSGDGDPEAGERVNGDEDAAEAGGYGGAKEQVHQQYSEDGRLDDGVGQSEHTTVIGGVGAGVGQWEATVDQIEHRVGELEGLAEEIESYVQRLEGIVAAQRASVAS